MKIHELYKSKQARDKRYTELLTLGRSVKRNTTGPCMLHPQYVKDFAGIEKDDTSIANLVYKMHFKNLYAVEEV